MGLPGRVFAERISYSQISELELATEENMNRLSGALGLGLVGDLALGPIGLLAGLIRGGRGRQFTFVCILKDGRRFLATAKEPIWARLNREVAVTNFNLASTGQASAAVTQLGPGNEHELSESKTIAQSGNPSPGPGWRTLWQVGSWVLFAIFAMTGIATIPITPFGGLGFLGLALLTFPLLNTLLEKHFDFRLPLWIRGTAGLALIILIGAVAPTEAPLPQK
jgi:hypothetical protein